MSIKQSISNSTIGANAIGDGASATNTGHLHTHDTSRISQSNYEDEVRRAQHALVDDQSAIRALDTRL